MMAVSRVPLIGRICSFLIMLAIGFSLTYRYPDDSFLYVLVYLLVLGSVPLIFYRELFQPYALLSALTSLILAVFTVSWSFLGLALAFIAVAQIFLRLYLPIAEIQKIDWRNTSSEELAVIRDELVARYDDPARKNFLFHYFIEREAEMKGRRQEREM